MNRQHLPPDTSIEIVLTPACIALTVLCAARFVALRANLVASQRWTFALVHWCTIGLTVVATGLLLVEAVFVVKDRSPDPRGVIRRLVWWFGLTAVAALGAVVLGVDSALLDEELVTFVLTVQFLLLALTTRWVVVANWVD